MPEKHHVKMNRRRETEKNFIMYASLCFVQILWHSCIEEPIAQKKGYRDDQIKYKRKRATASDHTLFPCHKRQFYDN